MSLTVGKLKEILSKYNDDVKIVTTSSNFELGSNVIDAKVFETKCVKLEKQFRDAFDGGRYTSEVYEFDTDGEEVIKIWG